MNDTIDANDKISSDVRTSQTLKKVFVNQSSPGPWVRRLLEGWGSRLCAGRHSSDKSPDFVAKRYQSLGMAAIAMVPLETVLEAAELEVILEPLLDMNRQRRAPPPPGAP